MITFLDENDVEYGALATIKVTNAVNGERSLTGTIVSGDYVLSKIERGWRLRFDDEYYAVTYAKPVDEGKNVQVSFDAVHQFFWDFGKSSVYDQLSDGSHTFRAYLDFIFDKSGYRYDIESSLTVKAFEKQSFGYKNRLSLFNDIITSSGVEFQVNGKVVRILAKVGTDLSTVVRKNFNLNELGIEKNIGDFVTYQKGFGAYFDEEDHSKGRLIVEYTSPLASVYGKLEANPLVDERYKQSASLLSALKETVDNSYTISVSLDMEDLTRAGYRYTQPVAGDYIMAINETLGFKEKIRIVSFTSEYDVAGQLIKHTVTCNDIGSVKKLSASYTQTQHQAANAEVNANTAYEFANKALVSANGKNTNYYGDTFPVDNPKGTLKKGDLLFLTVGDTVKQYYWNGADWVINPVLDDVEAFKEQIAGELKDVPNREEFENKIAEELANSKAEIETQIETAKTQAESNAKEYADTINQETAKVAEQANTAADEIKADLVNVKNNLTSTSLVANNAQAAVDAAKQDLADVTSELNTAKQDLTNSVDAVNTKVDSAKAELTQAKQDLADVTSELNTAKQDLTNSVDAVNTKVDNAKAELTQTKQQLTTVSDDLSKAKTDFQNAVSAVDTKATNLKSDLAQAKQDLATQAQQLQEQANAQSELTKRVSSVEKTADGTKTTVSELSKTVDSNTKNITSVTARTKVVEDDLAGTKTTLSQVKTTADSASQKTATLESGLNGLSAKFDNLKIGGANLLLYSADPSKAPSGYYDFTNAQKTSETYNGSVVYRVRSIWGGLRVNLGNLVDRGLLKVGDVLTYSVAMRAEQATPIQARLFIRYTNQSGADSPTDKIELVNLNTDWQYVSVTFTVTAKMLAENTKVTFLGWELTSSTESGKYVYYACNKVERGNVATDYSPSDVDLEQKVAEYKQTADQNYASLQTTVQNLDGTVQHNKTVADQTAQGFSTRIESLETYKDGESERANAYFESAKTETAKQLTAERTAIAKDYVAKSTYTSDVTGIRNDLTATTTTANTTKTNLANYQATNDRAVANLQSNIQTANGDISSLKTKVEAVPGQITSAVSAVESKIPTEIGGVNLFKGSRDFSGSWLNGGSGEYAEDYQGVKIFKRQNVWGGVSQFFEVKTGEEYVFSAYVKSSAKTDRVTFFLYHGDKEPTARGVVSYGSVSGSNSVDLDLTDKYKRIAVKIKITSSGWIAPRLERSNTDAYLFFGGYKLERGNIATDYSPAPEDTIEEINAVSSELKQTADGMTLLATKTELNTAKSDLQSGINTATNKANNAQATANNNAQTISTHTTQISALNTGLQAKVSQTDFNTLSGRVTTAENNITAKANELSSKITSVEGAIEDTQSDITKLSSEIKQTADGMTLLATKTELNSAKTDLQSGINTATNKANAAQNTANSAQSTANNAQNKANSNAQTISTHTTQISALNTGLSAKVSQSDFNTLSGRVTTAENNITAKANELSSKITSVEGKIPTSVGGRNYLHGTSNEYQTYTSTDYILGYPSTHRDWNKLLDPLRGKTVTLRAYIKNDTNHPVRIQMWFTAGGVYGNAIPAHSEGWSVGTGKMSTDWASANVAFTQSGTNPTGGTIKAKEAKLEIGNIPSDWSPAPEDAISQISNLSSQIQQTADGMTLLATKTELNTAKSDLQSGITTATNKANTAQNTANNNAQTISTHTTQISALNTGLSAKVSQTDFNTLSGRVTTAENNITAKANELSSKISSVEGKIPTTVGGRNYLRGTSDKYQTYTNTDYILGYPSTDRDWPKLLDPLRGKTVTLRAYIKNDTDYPVRIQMWFTAGGVYGNAIPAHSEGWSVGTGKMSANWTSANVAFAQTDSTATGGTIQAKEAKLEIGNIPSDWSPAPEDAQSDITKLSSEIKQTADGMTLLATKTELNSAKTDLQSGINTATNKANAAQNTANSAQNKANSNAQTISTHTTQISALNTGLQAKVSQTDFNTLSGRVTTAENNITAKANELTSKITSVEGAIEDTQSDITKLSSELKQTKDGITLLATKTELNTAKSELQSGINTATSKANSAQNTANNAQTKANSNAQTISTHTTQISALNTGLQAKVSQTDFNTLSGRVTTAENNITAKANELTSKITSVEGKIPTSVGSTNLLLYSADPWKAPSDYYQFSGVTKTDEKLNGAVVYKTRTAWSGLRSNWGKQLIDKPDVKVGDEFTYSIYAKTDQSSMKIRLFARFSGQSNADALTGDIALTNEWKKLSVTFKVTQKMVASQTKLSWVGFEQTSNSENGKFVYYACNKLERGNIATDYSPAPEDAINQISSLSSEFKQTTDSIKASVSSLDKSTVKSSSLTINSDGIVMKAGKSTSDFANAVGSYFSVNQNAINLFSDKINVKGNMIVNGAITSDKIASKSINTSHINGKIITADVIATNAITANAIKAGAVTTDKMAANSINGDRIAAGTLDAAKIKAGSITSSQIASGTITSNQIKAGGISSANIAAGAITTDKIAAGAIDASKIAANAISANMITGGQLRSTNGATVFDLNAGTLTFNNNYGYIQRVASDKIFEITTYLSTSSGSQEHLTSAFNIRKSDNSRQAGVKFTLYNTVENKPTAEAKMNADALILYDSQNTRLFSVHGKSTFAGGVNFQGWGDIPIAKVHGGLIVQDIGIGSHTKSLLKIVEELCKKAGILWV